MNNTRYDPLMSIEMDTVTETEVNKLRLLFYMNRNGYALYAVLKDINMGTGHNHNKTLCLLAWASQKIFLG